jgi:DNA polymerase-3 subunit gamma/tau
MVSPQGFNALLKVVEEPPEHLKFIFATTEPEKVIGTIRSRTHHYPFRLVPPGTLRDYLGEVCGKEDIPVADGVLPLVVRAGGGSVRDSMSVMDQLLSGAAEDGVTYAMATALLGYTDASLLDSIVDAFASGDGAAAFGVVNEIIEGGNDPRRFVADLLERLRDLVILAAVPDAGSTGLIDAPADVVERMQAQASVFGAAELSRAADLVNSGLTEMRGATSPRLQLELICARVLLPAAFDDERSVRARLDRLERGVATFSTSGTGPPMGYVPGPEAQAHAPLPPVPPVQQASAPAPVQAPVPAPAAAPAPAPASAPAPAAEPARRPGGWPTASSPGQGARPAAPQQPEARPAAAAPVAPAAAPVAAGQGAQQVRNMWPQILEAVKNRRRFTWILLSQNAQVAGFDGTTLQIGFINAGARDNFTSSGSEGVLKEALAEHFHVQWKVEAIVDPSGGAGGPAPGSGPATGSGPGGAQPPSSGGGSGGGGGGYSGGRAAPAAPAPQASASPASRPAPAASQQSASGPPSASFAPEPPRRAPAYTPPPVAPEDDTAEADDPDLVDSALSGHELIVRELGATVVEEYTND